MAINFTTATASRGVTLVLAVAAFALAPAVWHPAAADKFRILHSFCAEAACTDGLSPQSPLLMDDLGNLFGVTILGGTEGEGSIFALRRQEGRNFKFKLLFNFCRRLGCGPGGAQPTGALIADTQGNLYGITGEGGNGVGIVYRVSPGGGRNGKRWTETPLYDFCSQANCVDGAQPTGGLTYTGAASGVPYDGISPLYGVTGSGGLQDKGTVFSLVPNGDQWTYTVLHHFCSEGGSQCTDGRQPEGGLTVDQEGNLLGTTAEGGGNSVGKDTDGAGIVFELNPNGGAWTQTILYRFCSAENCADGAFPGGALVADAAGNLFGTTGGGGAIHCPPSRRRGCGTVFKLQPNGSLSQETVLYAFCAKSDCKDGFQPAGGVALDPSGNLFGVTNFGGGNDIDVFGFGGGTIFELSGTILKTLHRFCSLAACADGEYPLGGTIVDGMGDVFGATARGGAFAKGTAWRLKY